MRIDNKWQVRVAALILFALGFVAGALSLNLYWHTRASSPFKRRHDRIEQIADRLNLTGDQKAQVEAALSDARAELMQVRKQSQPKIIEIRQRTRERLQAALTPEQWEQFQQMTKENRGRRRGIDFDAQ